MTHVLLVGMGGFLGAAGRFLLGSLIPRLSPSTFPISTLCINLIGSFIIGMVIVFIPKTDSNYFYFLIPGLLGGFTTFSTFSSEAVILIERQAYLPCVIYISASVLGGILLCYLGLLSAKAILSLMT